MTSHLCISVTFLDPLFHGQGDNEPEWPPSPMRLFQALLAGSHAGCRSREWTEAKAEAFRWFERQKPPRIVAPIAKLAAPCTLFVPNNDSDKRFDRQNRLTSKISHPHRLCGGNTLHYLWPIDEKDNAAARSHADLVCRAARHLLALGWGIDQVVGNGRVLDDAEAAALTGESTEHWEPRNSCRFNANALRTSKVGALSDLQRVHRSFLDRVDGKDYQPPLKASCFDTVEYMRQGVLPRRFYVSFELPEGVAFRQVDTVKVAAMLRSAACRRAKVDTHEFRVDGQDVGSEVYVAGHVNGSKETPPRFSYLPLPTIGHCHPDGMIRRLLIAEPFGGDGTHARWAKNRLHAASLRTKHGKECGVLLDPWRHTTKAMIGRYVDPSQVWSTVTPIVLPGHDSGKRKKACGLFRAAVMHAGLPAEAIAEFELRKTPFWHGSQHARDYYRPKYLVDCGTWHVRLRFRDVVNGPLAIGAGRHCGLGLFAAER